MARAESASAICVYCHSEFSAAAGDLAGDLEDLGSATQLDEAARVLAQLETTVSELVHQIDGINVEELRRQIDAMPGL